MGSARGGGAGRAGAAPLPGLVSALAGRAAGTGAAPAACLLPSRSEDLQVKGPGETRCGQSFPAVVISAARSGWEWERWRWRSLSSRSLLPRDAGSCCSSPDPQPKLREGGGLTLGGRTEGAAPRAGPGSEEVASAFPGPRVGSKERGVGVGPSGQRR